MKAFHGARILCMLVMASWAFFACGIQSFEDLTNLNPPLALEVTAHITPVRSLELTFISYNYENNFSGFNVFVGIDSDQVNRQTRVIPNIRTESEPTFIMNNRTFLAGPQVVTLTITPEYRNRPPLSEIGERFSIGVAAYDAVYRERSRVSRPVDVDWTDGSSP